MNDTESTIASRFIEALRRRRAKRNSYMRKWMAEDFRLHPEKYKLSPERLAKNRIKTRQWLENHPDIKAYRKKRYWEHEQPERKTNPDKYKLTPQRAEQNRIRARKWRIDNRERRNTYLSQKFQSDPRYRLIRIHRSRIRNALNGFGKVRGNLSLVGCKDWDEFMAKIKSKLLPGMTMENYGLGHGKWVLDHQRPIASFNLSDPEQQKMAFHVDNLQPLWCDDNYQKSSWWNGKLHRRPRIAKTYA